MKVIIVGAGEVGYHIANRLAREQKDVVVIDKDEERLGRVAETLDVQWLHGSGSSPGVLKEAGAESADMLVAVTDSDEVNLVACLAARLLSPSTTRIARIRNPEYLNIREWGDEDVLGLSLIINPESEVVRTMVRLLEAPGAVDVIDFAEGKVRLIGLKINENSHGAGLRLKSLGHPDDAGQVLIAALYRDNRVIIPHGETRMEPGDLAYVVTRPEDTRRVMNYFGFEYEPVRRVFVVGGGQVGALLAQTLEENDISVKLVDRNHDRCTELGHILDRTVILHGDGTDQALLEEENVGDTDYFMAVTNNEEQNVLSCLLARRLGAARAVTRINKFAYVPLVSAIGLETMVSSRLSAVSAILRNLRKGKVVSAFAVQAEEAEVLEFEAVETAEIVGRPLSDIQFPAGALIAAIVRNGEVVIPGGGTVIEPGDRIIIFACREAVSKVEKALTVKLEYF